MPCLGRIVFMKSATVKRSIQLGLFLIVNLFFGVFPLVVYYIEKTSFVLPSPEGWYGLLGNNHGPWRWELKGYLVFYPLLLLTLLNSLLATASFFEKRIKLCLTFLVFFVIDYILLYFHAINLLWLID